MATFHDDLRNLSSSFAHHIYAATKQFPKEEMYGMTSQIRRSALSVPLNYIEGYARLRQKVHKNFIEISYGSLQETKFLLTFAHEEGYLSKNDYSQLFSEAEKIGSMLWGMIKNMD